MARADEFLAAFDDPSQPTPEPGHPSDEPLLRILVHMASSDGVLQDEELGMLRRLLPGEADGDIHARVRRASNDELDLDAISALLSDPEERWGAMRFAAALAWVDRYLDTYEKIMLVRMAEAFELPVDAVERTLSRIVGHPSDQVVASRVAAAIRMEWSAAELQREAVVSPDLVAVLPADAGLMARVLVDGIEMVGVADVGIAGRFHEGVSFLRWEEIASYNRVPAFGAAVVLVTHAGDTRRLVDHRLREVGALLDRVFAHDL